MNSLTFLFKGETFNPSIYRSTYILDYPCSTHKECYPIESNLPPAYYLLEVWGAQGGSSGDFYGGKGGYSRGILKLSTTTKAFFYIGAAGTKTRDSNRLTDYSFNGGGKGATDQQLQNFATSGGGGTDIRLNDDSLYNRIIVAGGGGGSSEGYGGCYGGDGGGNEGKIGTKCYNGNPGGQGTQTEPGNTARDADGATFGYGANKTTGDGSGGGGGWYGGGAGSGYVTAGSGGSGFIFNYENYETARKANLLLSTKYFLREASMIRGDQEMPSPYSSKKETGHSGNGVILITILSSYIKQTCTKSFYFSFIYIEIFILISI